MSFKSLSYFAKRTIFAVSEQSRRHLNNPQGYLDLKIGSQQAKRVVFELYADKCPYTVEQVTKVLANTFEGADGSKLSVKNVGFKTIIPSLYALTGELQKGEGLSASNKLVEENYQVSHDSEGILSLVNNENSNTSQFLITLGPVEWFDQKYVAFGKVVQGAEVLNELEAAGSLSGEVKQKVVIEDSGAIIPKEKFDDHHHGHGHGHH